MGLQPGSRGASRGASPGNQTPGPRGQTPGTRGQTPGTPGKVGGATGTRMPTFRESESANLTTFTLVKEQEIIDYFKNTVGVDKGISVKEMTAAFKHRVSSETRGHFIGLIRKLTRHKDNSLTLRKEYGTLCLSSPKVVWVPVLTKLNYRWLQLEPSSSNPLSTNNSPPPHPHYWPRSLRSPLMHSHHSLFLIVTFILSGRVSSRGSYSPSFFPPPPLFVSVSRVVAFFLVCYVCCIHKVL